MKANQRHRSGMSDVVWHMQQACLGRKSAYVTGPFPSGSGMPILTAPVLAPAMVINGQCNTPIGPGGGTRRLHPSPSRD